MKKIIHFLAFLVLMCGGAYAHAQSCKKIGTECIQGAETRIINGVSLTRSCWQYQDKYDCYESTAVDTCAPLREKQGCFELTATCSEKNYSGQCVRFATTMRCDHQEATPSGATALTPVFAVKQDELVASEICGKLSADANCTKTGRICSQGPETRIVNGMSVFKDCWQYQDQFSCVNPNNTTSTCDLYANNPKCTVTGSKCFHTLPGGQCGAEEKTYSCETKPAQTTSQEVCKNMTCDANGICIPSADQPDNDFGKVAAGMELARQIGVYTDPNNIAIFGGEVSECSKGKFNIKTCCTPKAGATNNAGVAATVLQGAASMGKELMDVGSMYVYDSLMTNDSLQQGMGTMISSVNNWLTPSGASEGAEFFNGKFDPSISYMGFTASWGAASSTLGSVSMGSVGNAYFSFNPYMLAGQLFISWALSCDAKDSMTALRKGQNLCHHVGTYCADEFFGQCIEAKESHCCFNSHLARIVQEQGRPQLGKGWGEPKEPQCGGFSADEFQRLDMSKMDLSEFIAEIQAKAVNTIPGTNRAVTNVTSKVTNYFGASTGSGTSNGSLYLPGNASGNLHQTATGNALNKATTKGTQ